MRTTTIQESRQAIAVDLHGYGRVARALIPRLQEHGITLATISDSQGLRAEGNVTHARRVFVDATAPRYHAHPAELWVAIIEHTLASGTPVATCNKAPLALAWARLARASRDGRAPLALSATVGGGTPVLHVLRRLQAAHGLVRLDALLSGTLTFIVDRLLQGDEIAEAVQQAQIAGYAEPDPTLDIDGTDAWAKAVILHNRLFAQAPSLSLRDRIEPLRLDPEEIRHYAEIGLEPQVVATVAPGLVALRLEGRRPRDALVAAPASVAVRATCGDGQVFGITGPGAGPAVTAGSILSDLLALQDRPDSTELLLP